MALIASQASAASELTDWGVILQGSNIRVGINSFGTFGNGSEYGSGINFDATGTGTFNFDYDFLAPGSPYDAFALSSGSTLMVDNNNDEWEAGQNVAGTITDYSGVAHNGETFDNRVVWSSIMDDVAISHDYFFNDNALKVQIRTTITALSDLTDLYFGRAVDPDAKVAEEDSSSTFNTTGTEGPFTYVYGEATTSRYIMGLLTDGVGTEAVVSRINNSWGFGATFPNQANDSAADYYGMTPYELFTRPADDADFNASGTTSDDLITLAFKLGDLATGESFSFLYSYIFGDDFESFVLPSVESVGTGTSLTSAAATTRAVMTQSMASLTRLSQQETAVIIPDQLSSITVSTKGSANPNRVALRFGALTGGTGDGNDVSVGSVTGAFQIDEKLVAGASYERASQTSTDQGFVSDSTSTALTVYLRSRNANGEGLTWKLAYGIGNGDIDVSRAAGVVGAEAGRGTADLRSKLASVELGYGIRASDSMMVSPFFRLSHATVSRAAYTEDATIAFPLSYDEAEFFRTTATFGVDAAFNTGPDTMVSLGAGLDHDLNSSNDILTGTSGIAGLATFATAANGPLDRSRLYVSANLRHNFVDGSSILVTGRLAEDAYSSSAYKTVGVNYEIRF